MTEAMPFLQKYDITFLRPPAIAREFFIFGLFCLSPDNRYCRLADVRAQR